mmetsp:Transcript_7398/g.19996  ORF Transcript_7398/g.19996 Transcript_7398/m.19996 type:complete len:226 (+) Transcript_7398:335-1012(+)
MGRSWCRRSSRTSWATTSLALMTVTPAKVPGSRQYGTATPCQTGRSIDGGRSLRVHCCARSQASPSTSFRTLPSSSARTRRSRVHTRSWTASFWRCSLSWTTRRSSAAAGSRPRTCACSTPTSAAASSGPSSPPVCRSSSSQLPTLLPPRQGPQRCRSCRASETRPALSSASCGRSRRHGCCTSCGARQAGAATVVRGRRRTRGLRLHECSSREHQTKVSAGERA